MRIVIDQSNYVPSDGEVLDNIDMVERDGYRDTETQVMEMMIAGERLNQQRKEDYDYVDDPGEDFEIDPTREVGFDLIDSHRLSSEVNNRLRMQAEAAEAAEIAKKEAEAVAAKKEEENK